MKKILLFVAFFSFYNLGFTQLVCSTFTATGPSSSGYNTTQDPSCSICGPGTTTPWTGSSCAGTITAVAPAPTTTMTLGFTSVNTNDFATISIDGGGVMNIVGTNVGVAGNVIGPYTCLGPYGDVFITVTSTLPFTTVTLVNTGCSSGWVVACPGGTANAGADDLTNPICSGTLDLNTLLSGADAGGTWSETTAPSSGQFNTTTGVFTVGGLAPGTYTFQYSVTSCGTTDISNFSVQVGSGGVSGADNTASFCASSVSSFNLNTLLSGADPGGIWAETSSSGQFNTTTGVFTTTGLNAGIYTFTYTFAGIAPCIGDQADFVVTLLPSPTAAFNYTVNGISSSGGPVTACINNPISFTNNSTTPSPTSITTNTWTYGNGDGSGLVTPPNYNYPSTGSYNIELTVTNNGGCTSSISVPIIITGGPTMTITSNEPTCYQFSDASLTINTAGGGPYTYIITNAAGTQMNLGNTNTANNLNSGWYYLNVNDGAGCAGLDSIFIDQPGQLNVDLDVFQPLCYGVNSGLAIADTVYNYNGSYNSLSYFWNPNPVGTNGVGKDSCIQLGPGSYALTINDADGCSRVFDFTITFPDSLYFNQLGYDPAYCRLFDYQSGNGVVYASAAGGTSDYSYGWTNTTTGAASPNTTWGGLNPGTYQITATDANGCIINGIVELPNVDPIAAFTATSGDFTSAYEGTAPVTVHFENQSQYFANPNNPSADTTFFWNFDFDNAGWVISHSYFDTFDTTYSVGGIYEVCLVAINKNGCTDTACQKLIIHDPLIFVPINIFTPNGDGANDIFTFYDRSDAVKEFNCLIVDRWGTVMIELNDITEGWNGKTKGGKLCPDGVYFYTYNGMADNGNLFEGQGTIQLINGSE